MIQKAKSVLVAAALISVFLASHGAAADGVSAVKECETDTSAPEDFQRLTIMPNGESRGSDSAAALVRTAKQKAKEGKDAEAVQWAALCPFEKSDQDAVKRDTAAVLQFLKQN
ncbi:MAG: hypothetical protein K2Z80_09665 [Xanthobacteraceae bacterium]|nr:hypothetical protein [Xanthobacteraceae bacterium]